jgi:hypothetical protein
VCSTPAGVTSSCILTYPCRQSTQISSIDRTKLKPVSLDVAQCPAESDCFIQPEAPTLGFSSDLGQQQRGIIGGKDSTREGSDCSSAASTKMPRRTRTRVQWLNCGARTLARALPQRLSQYRWVACTMTLPDPPKLKGRLRMIQSELKPLNKPLRVRARHGQSAKRSTWLTAFRRRVHYVKPT